MSTSLRQVSPEPIQLIINDDSDDTNSEGNQDQPSNETISSSTSNHNSPFHQHMPHIQSVEIIEATILRDAKTGSKHTTYTLLITSTKGQSLKLHKRYNDFVQLSQSLRAQYPQSKIQIPKLPPKTLMPGANFQVKFLERRRKGLEYFINSVLLNKVFHGSRAIARFIEEDEVVE
ncbi:hypothetical protein WICPIJ_002305 [Wickerhamomyces pijperi]|uniref:Endosomal/vacuolar adapter protein YPT35 n=1 Tax=Wickerhamomyces pijperi TaxID=599730 RepID=A0A9P8Q9X9_WICPI|nr:hypothetical protein WICPIJ_002305 [Wickerhamomyces pijperi]